MTRLPKAPERDHTGKRSEKKMSDSFQVFVGHASESLADIYLRCLAEELPQPEEVFMRGPFCSVAKTLKSKSLFEPTDDSGVWHTRLVDPCFWTPDYPGCYEILIRCGDTTVTRKWGLRRFGAKNGSFWLDGRRWVLRAAAIADAKVEELPAWRDARMTLQVEPPSDSLLIAASDLGVMLMVDLEKADWRTELARIAQLPAVAIAIVPAEVSLDECRSVAPNLLVAKRIGQGNLMDLAEKADLIIGSADDPARTSCFEFSELPLVGERKAEFDNPVLARAACDRLQADLAPRFQLSGYLV